MLSLKTTNKSLHATYLCSADSFGLKMGKKFVSLGRKRFSSSGSRSNDVTILQVFFAPQVMSRNYVRVPAHLLQKPPKKLAPAASSPFKVRRSNRCLERASERAFIKVRAIFPGGSGIRASTTSEAQNFQRTKAKLSQVRERARLDPRSRWTLSLSSHRKVVEERGERKWPTRVCRFWDSPWRSWA